MDEGLRRIRVLLARVPAERRDERDGQPALSPDEERAVREHLDRVMADMDEAENMRAWAWGK